MSLSSILPGRMPNSLATQRLSAAIGRGQAELNRLQEQISGGRRFQLPSEAPTAATQTLTLQKLDERRTSFQNNIQTNQGFLGASDQALATINDGLTRARGILQEGLGDQVSDEERQGLAEEVRVIIQSVVNAGNTKYNGRYIFAGSNTSTPPFARQNDGSIRYSGDARNIQTFANFDLLVSSGIDGGVGLRGLTPPIAADLNPALTLNTRLDQLNGGAGVTPGSISVVLANGPTEIRKTIDLTTAETLNDVKLRIEDAFAAESLTVNVVIDPGTNSGLRLTPSSGTVEVLELQQGRTALGLGLRSSAVAVLNGEDVNPRLSQFTTLASLNGNTGIGATAGTGLRIVNGNHVSTVDLNGATTIADVLDRIRAADPDVIADISSDGAGLTVSSRLSGVGFSIGENGGNNATALGLRTTTGGTQLADFNLGVGVPLGGANVLQITRRDATTVEVDLTGATTVQDVLDAINLADPGQLVASLNSVGNGITLTDLGGGSGPLTVDDNALAVSLGIDGSDTAGVLIGRDVNLQHTGSGFDLLSQLDDALEHNDFRTLTRLQAPLDAEAQRITLLRGEVGSRQQLLDAVDNDLADAHVQVKGDLSKLFDVDFTETVTAFLQQQQALQGAMQIAAQATQLSILQYL